ncbi:MAG: hypothetical protein K8T89_14950 [Planctomycetes bacterium]|nr:hypothetical protein [Planctomycetota bacterium]
MIVDEPSQSSHADPDDRRIVILEHPLETAILKELGVTEWSAGIGGRMLYIRQVVCRACGTLYKVRRLSATTGSTGCLVILCLSAGIGAYVGWQRNSFPLAFLAGWLGMIGMLVPTELVVSQFVRWSYQDRAKEFDRGPDCPNCHSKKYVCFRPPRWGKLRCPKCLQKSVRVNIVGKS